MVVDNSPKPGRQDDWLNARVAELVRQNPGGRFPITERELVDRVQSKITILTKYFLGDLYGRRGFEVEQESWSKLTEFFPRFEAKNDCKFTSWLFLVVRSVKSNVNRVENHEPTVSMRAVRPDAEELSGEIERALQSRVQVEFSADGYAAKLRDELLSCLSKRAAKIMRASLEGMTNSEISNVTGTPIGTVSSILSRARALFRKKLDRTRSTGGIRKKSKHAS